MFLSPSFCDVGYELGFGTLPLVRGTIGRRNNHGDPGEGHLGLDFRMTKMTSLIHLAMSQVDSCGALVL